MPRINVSVTDEFKKKVQAYARKHKLTESAALVEWAVIGCKVVTGEVVESAMYSHGGNVAGKRSHVASRQVADLPGKAKGARTAPKATAIEADPKPSVTLDLIKAKAAEWLKVFQFAHKEDGRGVLEWNVYTKTYKEGRPALALLLENGLIVLHRKEREKIAYKITPKGLDTLPDRLLLRR